MYLPCYNFSCFCQHLFSFMTVEVSSHFIPPCLPHGCRVPRFLMRSIEQLLWDPFHALFHLIPLHKLWECSLCLASAELDYNVPWGRDGLCWIWLMIFFTFFLNQGNYDWHIFCYCLLKFLSSPSHWDIFSFGAFQISCKFSSLLIFFLLQLCIFKQPIFKLSDSSVWSVQLWMPSITVFIFCLECFSVEEFCFDLF